MCKRIFDAFRRAVLLLVLALATRGGAYAQPRPFSLADMMAVESFGDAMIDPQGRWLVFERVRPYSAFEDYSFRTYAFGKSGHQIWRYDLHANAAPELLPGVDPAPHSYLHAFSPSGGRLAVMQYAWGELKLGAYDMASDKLVMFGPTPAFSRDGAHNAVWISPDELVYAALAEGETPLETSLRAHVGSKLTRAWRDAWRGDVSTASEIRTRQERGARLQKGGSLVRANASTGETERLADGLYADLRVSPDGRWLAALALFEPPRNDGGSLVQEAREDSRLVLFDLRNGRRVAWAQELNVTPYSLAWSADSRRVALFGRRAGETAGEGRFHVIDVPSGEVTRFEHNGLDLVSERERGWRPRPERVMFLGEGLAVFARAIPETEDQSPRFSAQDVRPFGAARADWRLLQVDGAVRNLTGALETVDAMPVHADADSLTIAARDGVYRVHANGAMRRLTPEAMSVRHHVGGNFATRAGVARNAFGDEALVSLNIDGRQAAVVLDLSGDGGSPWMVTYPDNASRPLVGSAKAGVVLFGAEQSSSTALVVARAGSASKPHVIAVANTHLGDVAFGRWRAFSYEAPLAPETSSGRKLAGCVLLPPDTEPGTEPDARLAVIVNVYPGSLASCGSDAARLRQADPHSPYLWAGLGFAYATLSLPTDLMRTGEGPMGGMAGLVEAGLDALVAEAGIDPDRMVLHGFSQGGVSALHLAAHTHRFRAVIAKNSWADLTSHYFGSAGIHSIADGETIGLEALRYDSEKGSEFGFGFSPFDAPEAYYRSSPVLLAPRIKAPVMLIHSDMDVISMSQFDEMFGALKRAGKDARYVRYWGEGHGPSSPANIRDMWTRMIAFLADHGVRADD